MEAIRLSLAAEEERKRREEKEASKEAKKDNKKKAKELRKVAKAQSRIGSGFHPIELDDAGTGSSSAAGKGKEVDRAGGSVASNPMYEPTSTLNTSALKDDPQKHLEVSRAQIQRETSSNGNLAPFDPFEEQPHRAALRNLSNASSSASSFAESYHSANNHGTSFDPSPNASGAELSQADTPPHGTPGTEPMFNFQSLAEAITPEEESKDQAPQYIEDVAGENEKTAGEQGTSEKSRAGLENSMATIKLGQGVDGDAYAAYAGDEIEPAPRIEVAHAHMDQKHIEQVDMVGGLRHQATQ
jgi:hypothetical protein